MKSLNSTKITKWQNAILIAALLASQSAYGIESPKIPKTKECIEALSKITKLGTLKEKATSAKNKTKEYSSELYKTRGLRLFLADVDPTLETQHNRLVTYTPFKENETLLAKLRNTLTLLNPFRWIGTIIKNQNYKFSPIASSLNYIIEKLSKKVLNKPKELSGFSTLLVQTVFLLTILEPGLNIISTEAKQNMANQYAEHVENNKEHYQNILTNDYRYAAIDKYLQKQLNLMVVSLYDNFQSMEGVDISSMENLRSAGHEYYSVYDSITNNALIQTFFLESEYTVYAESRKQDITELSVEKNVSQFCNLNLFQIACGLAEQEETITQRDVFKKEAFDLTHRVYESYELIDQFTHNMERISDNTDNPFIENATQFIDDLNQYHKEGLIPPNALNYLIKRDADMQLTLQLEILSSILEGKLISKEEVSGARNQAQELINTIREATKKDIEAQETNN